MKLKRMEAKEVCIGDVIFHIRPLGAMNAAYVFGDVTSIVLPVLGTVAVANGDDAKEKAMSLDTFRDMKLDTESLSTALGKINGQKLTTLIDELVLRFRKSLSRPKTETGTPSPGMTSMRFSVQTSQEWLSCALLSSSRTTPIFSTV